MTHMYNSSCNVEATNHGRPYNPAFMHPDDLLRFGLAPGEIVDLESAHDFVPAVVQPDDSLRRGLVSLSHNFGRPPDRDEEVAEVGSTASRLLADDDVFDRYSGQPLMTNVPVRVRTRMPGVTDPASAPPPARS